MRGPELAAWNPMLGRAVLNLTEWLLLIIAIPCALVTLAAVAIGWIFLVNWWDGWSYRMKCSLIPGYRERADRKSRQQVEKMIAEAKRELEQTSGGSR